MPSRSPDVVVVGGGLVGSALAYELLSDGAATVLIDRHDPGRATDAGAGILSPETHQDPDPDAFAIGMASALHYPGLVDRLAADGADEPGFAVTGSLLVAERPGDDDVMERAAQLIGTRTPGLVTEVGPAEAARHFPPLGPVRRALFSPAGRRVDGRALNHALRRRRRRPGPAGGRRRGGLPRSRPWARRRHRGGDHRGTAGRRSVALCGGAWSPALAEVAGCRPAGAAAEGPDRPPLPARHRQSGLEHRPTGTRVLPGPLARRAGGLRRDDGGRCRLRRPTDGRRAAPAPPRGPAHGSGPGPGHGGRDPGGPTTVEWGRPAGGRPAARMGERLRGHRARGRGAAARPVQRPGAGRSDARGRAGPGSTADRVAERWSPDRFGSGPGGLRSVARRGSAQPGGTYTARPAHGPGDPSADRVRQLRTTRLGRLHGPHRGPPTLPCPPPRIRLLVRPHLAPERVGGHPGRLRLRRPRARPTRPRLVGPADRPAGRTPPSRRTWPTLLPVPTNAVGFSAGGQILLRMAIDHPDRFERLALLGVGDNVFEEPDAEPDGRRHRGGPGARGRPGPAVPPAGPQHRQRPEGARRPSCADPGQPVRAEELAAVTCPVLVVLGDRDFITSAERLVEALPVGDLPCPCPASTTSPPRPASGPSTPP